MKTCESGKTPFKSEHEAKRVRNSISKQHQKEFRVYKCNLCFEYHFTTKGR